MVGRGGCPGCPGSAAPTHHPELRLGVFLPALPQTPMSQTHGTLDPILEQPGSANQTFRFWLHVSERGRDASALRPRLCQEPSGVRGLCSLPSYLEKQQQQLRPPAYPMLYISCLFVGLLIFISPMFYLMFSWKITIYTVSHRGICEYENHDIEFGVNNRNITLS